jgi:hypothetical protein
MADKSVLSSPNAETVKSVQTPFNVPTLDLSFKNIKDLTFLPNYKNLVNDRLT